MPPFTAGSASPFVTALILYNEIKIVLYIPFFFFFSLDSRLIELKYYYNNDTIATELINYNVSIIIEIFFRLY